MYHVKAIGIVCLLLYIISFAGSRIGVISRNGHRSTWNVILLFTFIATSFAGIFLALQTNYKWELGSIEKVLKWHVEFGIGLSFTAIFHISWHLSYFGKLLSPGAPAAMESIEKDDKISFSGHHAGSLFIIGFITGSVQLIFLKELLNLTGGYELAIGTLFCAWLIITATGSLLGRRAMIKRVDYLLLLLPFLGLLTFVLLLSLYRLMTTSGQTPSFIITIIIASLSLFPLCVPSGLLFVVLSNSAREKDQLSPGSSFATETAGGILSGIIVSVCSANILNNYQILLIVVLCSFLGFSYLLFREKTKWIGLPVLFTIILVLIYPPDNLIRKLYFRRIPIISSTDSRYGNISIADYWGQKTIFYNHRVYNFGGDNASIEENIHYAMLQHEAPARILLISGGLNQHIGEILKYGSVCEVTYIELDPVLVALENEQGNWKDDSRVNIITSDAFRFIKNNHSKYDIVILALPAPDNFLINRYYTDEFYSMIKLNMAEGGVIMTRVADGLNYPGNELISFISVIHNNLRQQFGNVLPVRGNSIYLIASDNSLSTDYSRLVSARGIDNAYFNPDYINDQIVSFNSEMISNAIDTSTAINTLNHPVAIFMNQNQNIQKSGRYQTIVIFIIASVLLLTAILVNFDRKRMFFASFSVAGTEIISLVLFQSVLGYIYQSTGIIIAFLMAGLAVGSYIELKWRLISKNNIALLMALAYLLFLLIQPYLLHKASDLSFYSMIILFALIPAFLTGTLYRILTINKGTTGLVSCIYGSDLLGAAFGFLLFSGIVIPLLGISNTIILLAIINFAVYISGKLTKSI